MTDLSSFLALASAAARWEDVEVVEMWRQNVSRLRWNGPTPDVIEEILAAFGPLAEGEQPGLVFDEIEQVLRIVRPSVITRLAPELSPAASLYLTTGAICDALRDHAALSDTSFTNHFEFTRTLICPALAVDRIDLNSLEVVSSCDSLWREHSWARREREELEPIQEIFPSLARLHPNVTHPRPDLIVPKGDHPGEVFAVACRCYMVHALAALADEVEPGPVAVFGSPRATRIPLTWTELQRAWSRLSSPADSVGHLHSIMSWVHKDQSHREERAAFVREQIAHYGSTGGIRRKGSVVCVIGSLSDIYEGAFDSFASFIRQDHRRFLAERQALSNHVRGFAESYSERARTLITGLTRDTLAGAVVFALLLIRATSGETVNLESTGVALSISAIVILGVGLLQIIWASCDVLLAERELRIATSAIGGPLSTRIKRRLIDKPVMLRRSFFIVTAALALAAYGFLFWFLKLRAYDLLKQL